MGYYKAGFTDIVGVDINPQPHYPFTFIQADAVNYAKAHGAEFDAIHASPPCQAWTLAQRIRQRQHPDFIVPIRQVLQQLRVPYIIENVEGAPLVSPVLLCGAMFGLCTYRHRLFECSFPVLAPEHPPHVARITKMGRRVKPGEFMHIVGNFSGVELARKIMDMPWATRRELREAIPPTYTEYLGAQLMQVVRRVA